MIRQFQFDALKNWLDDKISEIKTEIATREEAHAQARNRSEYLDMKFNDEMTELEWKLKRFEQLRDEAETLEIEEEPEFPAKHLYLPIERRAARSIL